MQEELGHLVDAIEKNFFTLLHKFIHEFFFKGLFVKKKISLVSAVLAVSPRLYKVYLSPIEILLFLILYL